MLNQYYTFFAQQVQIHNYLYFHLCTKSAYFCRVCASVANVTGISRRSSGHSRVRGNLHQTNCRQVWISPIRVGVDGDEAAARPSVNTNEADEGRWKNNEPRSWNQELRLSADYSNSTTCWGDEWWGWVGVGRAVDVRFHAVAALLLILRRGLAVMNGIPGLCGVVLSTQVKQQRIGRMGVGSRVIKRRLHEWPLRRSYQARIVAPALRSV